jgi:AcrR family transcriptional regulator
MAPETTDETTARIKRQALRRFVEVGYGSATVDDIAGGAGVGVATLYRRWPDKQSLANELMSEHLDDLEEVYQPVAGGTAKRRFMETWHRLWRLANDKPHLFLFGKTQAHAGFLSEEVAARKEALNESAVEVVKDLGIGAPTETAAAMILGTVTVLIQEGLPADPDDLGERLWSALQPS